MELCVWNILNISTWTILISCMWNILKFLYVNNRNIVNFFLWNILILFAWNRLSFFEVTYFCNICFVILKLHHILKSFLKYILYTFKQNILTLISSLEYAFLKNGICIHFGQLCKKNLILKFCTWNGLNFICFFFFVFLTSSLKIWNTS